jgi:hypothetical protein
VARLRQGATVEAATSDAEALIQRFGEAGYGPEWLTNVFTGRAVIRPLTEQVVGDARQPLLIVFATVVFVLLIACSNVANLLLVRAESRVRDTAVKVAMGAGRARLVQAVLIESVLISLTGGALGVLLAWIGVRALVGGGHPPPRRDRDQRERAALHLSQDGPSTAQRQRVGPCRGLDPSLQQGIPIVSK